MTFILRIVVLMTFIFGVVVSITFSFGIIDSITSFFVKVVSITVFFASIIVFFEIIVLISDALGIWWGPIYFFIKPKNCCRSKIGKKIFQIKQPIYRLSIWIKSKSNYY